MPNAIVQPSFQIVVIDPSSGLVTMVYDPTAFQDLRYSRVLNDIGVFTLTLPYTPANRAVFSLDSFVEIYRTNPVTNRLAKEDTYLCRYFDVYRQGNIENLIISGFQLNHLVSRRVVDPADDPNAAGGYSTYAGQADFVMQQYAYYNMAQGASAARQIPNLSIGAIQGVGLNVGYRLRFDDLYKTYQDCTARAGVDFNIQRTTGNNLELDIGVIGTDRRRSTNYPWGQWVALDPRRGNLQDPHLTLDRKTEKNVVYALGQGQDVNRQLLKIAGDNAGDSPLNRIEYTDTSTNVQKGDPTGLLTAARASLKKNGYIQTFQYKGTEIEPGNVYQEDWGLGDLVTAQYDSYSADLRITSVELFINNAGQTIQTKVSPI